MKQTPHLARRPHGDEALSDGCTLFFSLNHHCQSYIYALYSLYVYVFIFAL